MPVHMLPPPPPDNRMSDLDSPLATRNRPLHYSRDYRRKRIKADPNYAKKEQRCQKAWLRRKLRRCPEFAEVVALNNRLNKLRGIIEDHKRKLALAERELISKAKLYNALREKCRGK